MNTVHDAEAFFPLEEILLPEAERYERFFLLKL